MLGPLVKNKKGEGNQRRDEIEVGASLANDSRRLLTGKACSESLRTKGEIQV